MSNEHELLKLIDDYINGKLSGTMLQDFEQKMETNTLFKEEVLMHQEVNELLTAIEIEEVTAKAKSLLKENKSTIAPLKKVSTAPSSKTVEMDNSSRFKWLKIAAICLLFLLPILYFAPSIFQPTSSPQLASTYFEAPRDLVSVTRSTETLNQQQKIWLKANEQYQQKNYTAALGLMEQLPNSDTLALAKGLCHYLQNQTSQAIPFFQKVVQTPRSGFDTKASWYLALSYLKLEKNNKAIPLLQKLEKESVGFHEEAVKILKEIEK